MKVINTNLSYLRVVSIICIVFHHCFCIYTGWPPNTGLVPGLPDWLFYISELSKTFGLAMFTFISGYLLFYQKKKHLRFIFFIWNKSKRILLPAVIFGGLYWILFPQYMFRIFPACINGTHLWYLPMLFLCMLIVSSHFYLGRCAIWSVVSIWIIIIIYNKYSMFSFRTFMDLYLYLPVFYTGYLVNKYESFLCRYLNVVKFSGISVGILSLIGFLHFKIKLLMIIFMIIISAFTYLVFRFIKSNPSLGTVLKTIDKNSFSIYLFHQFIINCILFFCFDFINSIGWECTVLMLFILSFCCSLFIGMLYEKLKYKCFMVIKN